MAHMGSVVPDPVDPVGFGKRVEGDGGAAAATTTAALEGDQQQTKLDAGALFVLESKGSWLHCGYHLTTAIVSPAIISLPYALAKMGWAAGVIWLTFAFLITFYSYTLVSQVLEHEAKQGRRLLRFRDMGTAILGPRWGRYYIGPIQFAVCYAAVIGSCLLAGQSMKSLYLLSNPTGTMKLYEFIIIFGAFTLVLAQIPSFHSLRHLNLFSLFFCLIYAACITAAAINAGKSGNAPPKDYSLPGNSEDRVFGVFSAIAIIGTTYGNGIIPEIQATASAPVTGKMFKGLCLCYAVVVSTFFTVAIAGYWAFGKLATSNIVPNFFAADGSLLVPTWLLRMTNVFILLQLAAVAVVYLQPTNEVLEGLLGDPNSGRYSVRNLVPRLVSRSVAVVIATTFAAMLPFFGDLNALIGAFGFLPLDFVMPSILYNLTFKPSKRGVIFWVNTAIATVFSVLSVLGSIAAVRQIVKDAKDYKLFANV